MGNLPQEISEHISHLPEGKHLTAKELLHLGKRAAIDQALSRLVKSGQLIRVSRGMYVAPLEGRFGTRPPAAAKTVQSLGEQRGETVVPHGAAAANALGLTTQVPMREVYLTSGPSRELKLGAQIVELRHAPAWQLVLPGSVAGDAVRALAWLGFQQASAAREALGKRLSPHEREALLATRGLLPTWMRRKEISGFASHA